MKIVVCIKRVADTEAKIKIGADGKSIDPTGVEYVLNPYDEYAVEEALQLRDKHEGEVIVLTLGAADSTTTIRTALAMGADSGILLKDDNAGSRDFLAVAGALAEELKTLAPDLILLGKQAVDDDAGAVGTALAQKLGLPSVANITALTLDGTTATVERETEGGREKLTAPLPALFTAQKGLNEPRYPSLKGIMSAKKKPIEEKDAASAEAVTELTGLALPPERPPGKIVGHSVDAVPELVNLLRNEAKAI